MTNRNAAKVKRERSRASMAASRAQREAEGYKQVAVMLTPKAAGKLAQWAAKGFSAPEAISRLLEASKP